MIIWYLINKTTLGYELRSVGFNSYAAEYGGSKLNLVGAPKEVLDIIMGAIVLIIAITHVFKAFAQKKMQKGGK